MPMHIINKYVALHGLPVQPPTSHRKSPPPSANRAVVSKSVASPPASALPLVVSLLPLISCVLAILASKRLMPVPVARARTKMAHLPTQLHVHVAVQTRPSFVLRMSTAMQKTKCAPRIRFRLAPTLVASSTIPLAAHVAQLTARTTVLLVCIAARRTIDVESTPFVRRVMGLMRIQLPVLVVQTIARMSQNYFVIRHVVCAVRPTSFLRKVVCGVVEMDLVEQKNLWEIVLLRGNVLNTCKTMNPLRMVYHGILVVWVSVKLNSI